MKKILLSALLALISLVASVPSHAAAAKQQVPGGYAFRNDGSQVSSAAGLIANGTYLYPWKWSGPYVLSAVSYNASVNVISPIAVSTGVTSAYSGAFRVIGMGSQTLAFSAGTASTPQALTWSVQSLGPQYSAGTVFDSNVLLGPLSPNTNLYVQTTGTAGTANNFVYYIGELNW